MARDDLKRRLSFLQFDESDSRRLATLARLLEENADEFVEDFYRHLLRFPETRRLLQDEETAARLRQQQRGYLLSLAGPVIDRAYVADRRGIGGTHERIGLAPRWYLGAYGLYLSRLTPLVMEAYADDPEEASQVMVSLQRIVMLDAQLAIESYIERREIDLERLNQELSRAKSGLERDVAEQRREITRTTQRARAAEELASVGTLVAGLAHEIGTPMGVIQGHAKLLEPAVEGEKAQWRLATIREQIGRISRIIQSLLNMARPSSAGRQLVDLDALVETSLSFLTEKFSHRGVRVVRDFSPVPGVLGNPERLQQLCLNLFLNAVDAMPEGGELRVTLETGEDGCARIRVADDGVGIPPGEIDHIFDPFYTSKPAGRGSGLGLMVASGIVSDHGGEIAVESAVGQGTEFIVDLPPAGAPPASAS